MTDYVTLKLEPRNYETELKSMVSHTPYSRMFEEGEAMIIRTPSRYLSKFEDASKKRELKLMIV
jgi:hypothetical protein